MLDLILSILGVLVYVAEGMTYVVLGSQHARAVDDRLRAHEKSLGTITYLWFVFAWPLTVTLWVMTSLAVRRRLPRPFTQEVKRARLALEKKADETRRDWESRAAFWYAEGQRAEAEDNQALKWAVAEQLSFLLDTRPGGAQTPEERDESRATTVAKVKSQERPTRVRAVRLDESSPATPIAWAPKKRQVPSIYTPSGDVGFCNVCARYRDRSDLMMEGVCRECSEQQGLS